ncbi:MAG: glucose 1-dehydrogenase [Nitrososphaerales archaeon]
MKAIVVTPKQMNSLELTDREVPELGKNQMLLEVQKVGICGTDRDIIAGFYGEAPKGSTKLTLGHESLCRVRQIGAGVKIPFNRGELVVPTVRRPCWENCLNCRHAESDFCTTGDYKEHGIKQLDGFASGLALTDASYVVRLPEALSEVGVLLEPLTVVEKGLIQTFLIQSSRLKWKPTKALVLGAGPVGLLAAAILRLKGLEVDAVATRSKESLKAKLVEQTGARYINAKQTDLHILDAKYDIVFEVTGSPPIALEAQDLIRVNGVVCYLGIYRQEVDTQNTGKLFTDMVLGNKIHFGSVNANRSYFERGAKDLMRIKKRWPTFLERIITKKAKPEDLLSAYRPETQEEIKTVIEFS